MIELREPNEWERTVWAWRYAMDVGQNYMTAKYYRKLLQMRGYTGRVLAPPYLYCVSDNKLYWIRWNL